MYQNIFRFSVPKDSTVLYVYTKVSQIKTLKVQKTREIRGNSLVKVNEVAAMLNVNHGSAGHIVHDAFHFHEVKTLVNTVTNLRVPKLLRSSSVATQLAASQEGLSSMKSASQSARWMSIRVTSELL
jgi:hypothetical protein